MEIDRVALALAKESRHPLSEAICEAYGNGSLPDPNATTSPPIPTLAAARTEPGLGVIAEDETTSTQYYLGSERWMQQAGLLCSPQNLHRAATQH